MSRRALRSLLSALAVIAVGGAAYFCGPWRARPSAGDAPKSESQANKSAAIASEPKPAPHAATTASAASTTSTPASAIVAFHELPVDEPLLATARASGDPAALRSFRVRLGPDRFAEVDVARFDALNDDEGVYSGTVRGQRDSQAVFSYVGLAHAGTVVLPGEERAFCITATEDGRMRITELDLTRAPVCGQPLLAQGTSTDDAQ